MLQSGARWRDCPREYGPYTTVYNRFNRWAKRGRWCAIFEALAKPGKDARRAVARLDLDQSSPGCLRRKRGEHNQAIGRSRGGRTTKIHALTDACCRPIAFLLTGGQVADCIAADELLDRLLTAEILHGDKGYDSDAVRRKIENKGAAPNI